MFKRIMVPVDLTDKNANALTIAAKIALQNRARVTLVHVIETVKNVPLKEMKDFYKRLEKNAKQKMNALAGRLHQDEIPVEQEIIYGNRTQEIVKFAEENRIDLIVLSSHKVDFRRPGEGWGTIDQKSDNIFTLDLKVDKEFRLGDYGRFDLILEIFNLTNSNPVIRRATFLGGIVDGVYVPNPNLNRIQQFLSPRVLRLGLRYSF